MNKLNLSASRAVLLRRICIIAAAAFMLFAGIFLLHERISIRAAVPDRSDWNLILANRKHSIPSGYSVQLTRLSNGEQVDSRIYPALQSMFDDMRAREVYPVVAAGYRTSDEQQRLMDEKIQAYRAEGASQSSAKKQAREWVAVPGTSEHELGIAVDINADTARCSGSKVYSWLAKHAYQYGFIQRYPPEKTAITGIANEPWHYRYVGKAAAREIYTRGVCLEEYLS